MVERAWGMRIGNLLVVLGLAWALLAGCGAGGAASRTPTLPPTAPPEPTPTATPAPTSTSTPKPPATPTREATPTVAPIERLKQTIQERIASGEEITYAEVFDEYTREDELNFFEPLRGAEFYLGHLLEVMGVTDLLQQANAAQEVGFVVETTFRPIKRTFGLKFGDFKVRFCGVVEQEDLSLHLVPADETTAQLMDPIKLGDRGFRTITAMTTWYGVLGPLSKGGPDFNLPGKQRIIIFGLEEGEVLGVLETQTLFDKERYWGEFIPKHKPLMTPYNYKGKWRLPTDEDNQFVSQCQVLLQEQK